MSHSSISLAFVAVALVGFASRGGGPGNGHVAGTAAGHADARPEVRNTPAQEVAEYGAVAEYEQFERQVERDVAAADFGRVKEGLDAFMRAAILEAHPLRGSLFFTKLQPVWRLQGMGGERFIASVEQQQRALELAVGKELARAHASIERGD